MRDEGNFTCKLRVEELDTKDAGRGIVRISPDSISFLNLDLGDVVGIRGTNVTCARVMISSGGQNQSAFIQMDNVTMGNAGTTRGAEVELYAVDVRKAEYLIF